jgi:hypothetical protein
MNADEDAKDAKSGSSGQGNPGARGATNQPAKRPAATKRTRPAKAANGGRRGGASERESTNVAAQKAFEDLVRELGGQPRP